MKKWMRKATALLLALMLVISFGAFAEKETVSDAFRLPEVQQSKPEDVPAGDDPIEGEPVEGEPTEGEPAEGEPAEGEPVVEEPVEEPAASPIGKATVTLEDEGSHLNIRAEANTSSAVVGTLENGDVVSVLADEGEWLWIRSGVEGYVKASFMTRGAVDVEEEPIEDEPVIEEETEVGAEGEIEDVEEPVAEEETEVGTEDVVEEEIVEEIPTYYNSNGNVIPYDENGELILPEDIEYDENGNPILYDAEGNVIGAEAEEEEIVEEELPTYYDANGNVIPYDENGELILPEDIEYDENGNPILYDAEGNVIGAEVEEEEIVEEEIIEEELPTYYDANGNVIPYDENGELILPEDIEYDENGNPILYDAEGNVIGAEAEEEIVEAAPVESEFEVVISIINPKDAYFVGDTFGLQSTIVGVCYEPAYQWQVLRAGNEDAGWVDIPGANSSTYEFQLTPENFVDSYRVNVEDTGAPMAVDVPLENTPVEEVSTEEPV